MNRLYDLGRQGFLDGSIDWDTDDIKCVLVDLADYTPNFSTDNDLADVPGAARVSTSANLTGKTVTAGVADADDVVFTAVTGDVSEAVVIYQDTGVEGTSRLIAFIDGKQLVTAAADAAGSATSMWVEALTGPIASGAQITFSPSSVVATLSAPAAEGDRQISVNALSGPVDAGETGEVAIQGSGLPVTPNGGNLNLAWDNGANRIFKL